MSSPERDKELLKERLQLKSDQQIEKVGGFMGRFSDNEDTKRHKITVVEQQRQALLS